MEIVVLPTDQVSVVERGAAEGCTADDVTGRSSFCQRAAETKAAECHVCTIN